MPRGKRHRHGAPSAEQVLNLVVKLALAGRLTERGVLTEDCRAIRALWKPPAPALPLPDGPGREALQECVDVLLRMIPDYCADHGAKDCTDAEHDAALKRAGKALYGASMAAWPEGLRKAAEGRYE